MTDDVSSPTAPDLLAQVSEPDKEWGLRDEDEVILDWLRANLSTLPFEDKRAAVRRLCNEYGHTTRGLSGALGIAKSTVGNLRASDEAMERERAARRARSRRNSRVFGSRIYRFADEWQERASKGLSATDALQLLNELRALVPSRETP